MDFSVQPLCLCVSVVVFAERQVNHRDTETQRLHREDGLDFLCKAGSGLKNQSRKLDQLRKVNVDGNSTEPVLSVSESNVSIC